jgi:hypothetical protein
MFGSEILEVAIGVTFIILLVSLAASIIRELIEAGLKTRAIQLERGIRQLLDDPEGTVVAKELFEHPLLFGLFAGTYDPRKLKPFLLRNTVQTVTPQDGQTVTEPAKRMPFRSNLPSYIPARNFAVALLDIVGGRGAHGGGVPSLTSIQANALALPDGRLRRALLSALGEAGNDFDRARASLEAWFDGTMDRVSGWYKRETQLILLGLGLLIAIVMNVDSLGIIHELAKNNSVRQGLISRVDAAYPNMKPGLNNLTEAELQKQLSGLSDIIGWSRVTARVDREVAKQEQTLRDNAKLDTTLDSDAKKKAWVEERLPSHGALWTWFILISIPGWILTALAVSLGAPFWFDLLNKLMVIRSTVKPYEKSPAEGSEDRRGPAPSAERLAPRQPATSPPARAAPVQLGVAPSVHSPAPATLRLAIDDFGGLDPGSVQLTCNGSAIAVPPDGFVEYPLDIDNPHQLVAKASHGGASVGWTQTLIPTRNDDAVAVTARLT